MAEQLLFCADNVFNPMIYPLHTIAADAEVAGYEGFHVGNGRRHVIDRWQSSTVNGATYIMATCDKPRGVDFMAIDRESNMILNVRNGNTSPVTLYASDDAMVTYQPVFSQNLPGVVGGRPIDTLGAVTDEGAWIKTFATALPASYWNARFLAMGTGVAAQVTGLWVGKSWQPTEGIVAYPLQSETYARIATITDAPSGWRGSNRPALVRRGVLSVRLASETDYDMVRYQVLGLFAHGFPAWLAWQKTDEPWRAMLVEADGDFDWARDPSWHAIYRSIDIPFRESQPVY